MAVSISFVKSFLLFTLMIFSAILFAVEEDEPVDLVLKDVNGQEIKLSDYRGKWVVVNYWATWCPPCLEEIPDLVHFHESRKDKDAVVIGIDYEEISSTRLNRFIEENMMTYPVIPMRKGDKPESIMLGAIPGLPTTYLITPEGKLIARNVGPITSEMIDAFIKRKTADASKTKTCPAGQC